MPWLSLTFEGVGWLNILFHQGCKWRRWVLGKRAFAQFRHSFALTVWQHGLTAGLAVGQRPASGSRPSWTSCHPFLFVCVCVLKSLKWSPWRPWSNPDQFGRLIVCYCDVEGLLWKSKCPDSGQSDTTIVSFQSHVTSRNSIWLACTVIKPVCFDHTAWQIIQPVYGQISQTNFRPDVSTSL